MKCPRCGEVVVDGKTECPVCFFKVEASIKETPPPPPSTNLKSCVDCGGTISKDALECPHCGLSFWNQSRLIRCSACGRPVSKSSASCVHCGQKMGIVTASGLLHVILCFVLTGGLFLILAGLTEVSFILSIIVGICALFLVLLAK